MGDSEEILLTPKKIGFIGVGRLGLVTALCFERVGYDVLAVDSNDKYVDALNSKTFNSPEKGVSDLLKNSKNIRFTLNLTDVLDFADIIFIVVPTPEGGGDNYYDHSILGEVLTKVSKLNVHGKTFIISCTVMPGYINQIGNKIIENLLECQLVYNPEFIAQGEIIKGFLNPDIILIGTDQPDSRHIKDLQDMYKSLFDGRHLFDDCFVLNDHKCPSVCVLSCIEAEITKISINGFITTKIAYANMIGDLCLSHQSDPDIVLKTISLDRRIGSKCFGYGFAYGGPCFPRDTKALTKVLEKKKIEPHITKATDSQNGEHTTYQYYRLLSLLNYQAAEINLYRCSTYKPNTIIIDGSATLAICQRLSKDKLYTIQIHDIQIIVDEVKKKFGNIFTYSIVSTDDDRVGLYIKRKNVMEQICL